jgi:F-type H+-transporting ATPase subunit epsilon
LTDPWHLQVLSPDGAILDLQGVDRVQVGLTDGPITILQGHIPLIGETVGGALRYRTAGGVERQASLQPGVLIVERGRVSILTSGVEPGTG